MCDPSMTGFEYLLNFEFIKALTCTYANPIGFLVVGLLVYGGISLSIYIRTGSIIIPFVLLLLTGGVVMQQVAGVAVAIATLVALGAGAGVVTYVYAAYSR